ncbi:hypothetical protein EXIGLDRAFT_769564 [Exidia glandulosa HHB12029]|uniref:Uncharacterized protein n=1 Tax=Exidia glandulosa HHB12029 TaxID=1314781 RepID=A0A165HCY6_EXIGL|nr:hypothetical protein EXIGLDRAFT_769564 [Exidia glandulosa HHB12029]
MSYPPSAPPTETCVPHTPIEDERAQNSPSTELSSSSSSAIAPSRTHTPTVTSPVFPSSQQRNGVALNHETPSSVPATEAPQAPAPSSSGMGASRRGLASPPQVVAGNSRAASRVRTYTALDVFAGVVPPTQPQQHSDLEHVL